MRTPHTRASRLATVLLGALGLLQLLWVMTTDDRTVATLLAPLGVLTLLAMLKMVRDNCFESRLAAVVLATVQVVAVLLATTVGLPGRERQELDLHVAASFLAAAGVLVLVAADRSARARRRADRPPGSYAS